MACLVGKADGDKDHTFLPVLTQGGEKVRSTGDIFPENCFPHSYNGARKSFLASFPELLLLVASYHLAQPVRPWLALGVLRLCPSLATRIKPWTYLSGR